MIRKLMPPALKKNIRAYAKHVFHFKEYSEFLKDFLEQRKLLETHIPKYKLESKHIQNLQVLVDRNTMLMQMPKGAVVAELGVNKGEFSESILAIAQPAKLHLIDAWGNPQRYHDGLKLLVHEKFRKEISAGKVEINVGNSTDVLRTLPDSYFDWVYLDTDHSYQVTAEELSILKHKVKPKGIIAGHDYIIGNWMGDVRYGVIEAVNELCVKENWELVFTTMNITEMPSFAIKKIS